VGVGMVCAESVCVLCKRGYSCVLVCQHRPRFLYLQCLFFACVRMHVFVCIFMCVHVFGVYMNFTCIHIYKYVWIYICM